MYNELDLETKATKGNSVYVKYFNLAFLTGLETTANISLFCYCSFQVLIQRCILNLAEISSREVLQVSLRMKYC